jgi:hypothetical protein
VDETLDKGWIVVLRVPNALEQRAVANRECVCALADVQGVGRKHYSVKPSGAIHLPELLRRWLQYNVQVQRWKDR